MTVEDLIKSIAGVYADCLHQALDDARKNVKNDSWDLGTLVKNATWSAYCEGLEEALRIVDECTAAGLKELAAKRASQASPGVSKAMPSTPTPVEDCAKDAQAPTDQ